jgi:hypothetical protein
MGGNKYIVVAICGQRCCLGVAVVLLFENSDRRRPMSQWFKQGWNNQGRCIERRELCGITTIAAQGD